jgi:hypothetical protein
LKWIFLQTTVAIFDKLTSISRTGRSKSIAGLTRRPRPMINDNRRYDASAPGHRYLKLRNNWRVTAPTLHQKSQLQNVVGSASEAAPVTGGGPATSSQLCSNPLKARSSRTFQQPTGRIPSLDRIHILLQLTSQGSQSFTYTTPCTRAFTVLVINRRSQTSPRTEEEKAAPPHSCPARNPRNIRSARSRLQER